MARLGRSQTGFTLVELLVVVGIIAILAVLAAVNLGQTQTGTKLSTTVDALLTDLKSQQLLSMVGDIGSTTAQQPHGLYIQSNQYTLFASSSYNAGDNNNFVVSAPQSTSFTTTFPSSVVIFNKGDGSINGFTAGSNTITVTNGATTKIVTLTRFGAMAVN